MASFSERYGYESARAVAQIESMDGPLRNGLWNCVYDLLMRFRGAKVHLYQSPLNIIGGNLWRNFYRLPADEMPSRDDPFFSEVKERFMSATWFTIYDLVEYFGHHGLYNAEDFEACCNVVMKREMAGYTIIDHKVTPIVDEQELREVAEALEKSSSPVNVHLQAAVALLSDRQDPNFRKSINESISAVEAAVRELTGDPKATLGEGLKKLRADLHPALKAAFEKLYGYTSDEGGIRHGLTADSEKVDLALARFFLITCSAFVNYLRAKSKESV
jgi:hypothetical protein